MEQDHPTLTAYTIGRHGLSPEPYDRLDPRGQLLCWEPPSPAADYVMGVDPTMGILGWSRMTRTDEDEKHDNAAIEVFRVGAVAPVKSIKKLEVNGRVEEREVTELTKLPDVQVAEWAGPLDAEDLAIICNFIGRLYGGSHEDHQALAVVEVYPGPGWLTQRVMHDQLGYDRFLPWLVEGRHMLQHDTGRRGWVSNAHTRRDLWTRSGGHIKRRKAVLRSTHFVEEMVLCTPDNFIAMTARAARLGRSRLNDDRVVAGMLALWAANEWQIGQEPSEPTVVSAGPAPDYQLTDLSYEAMMERWNDLVGEI